MVVLKLLFVSDSFKGSLSSKQTAVILTKAAREVFGVVSCDSLPVADGGEGTVDAVIAAKGGEKLRVPVHGPLMQELEASYGKIDEKRAILEMASASGLTLVPSEKRNPLYTTSYGTGELIRAALDRGFCDLSIAIGGSSTNDGGTGCIRALGVRILDKDGKELEGTGRDLEKISVIDISGMDDRIKRTKFTVMCDVENPLCGEQGATYTFGGQKGGTPEELKRLEAGMQNYQEVIRRQFGVDLSQVKGSGAAGGLGAALYVFLDAQMRSGIETVLDLIDFDARLEGVDLVVTGEGCTDGQSCFGKVMQGVGMRAKEKGIAVAGLSGSLGKDADKIYEYGIGSLMTTVNAPMTVYEALERAEELYYQGAVRMFRFIRMGMEL